MFRSVLAGFVVGALLWPSSGIWAQLQPERLRIIPLEGNSAVNHIPTRRATAPVVEVRDANERAVEGAEVTFKLPETGPGGSFENGAKTQSTVTDFRGQAAAKPYTINDIPGSFTIEVFATYKNSAGSLAILQTNSEALSAFRSEPRRGGKAKWIWLGVTAAAGAGVGIYFATRPSNKPISISTGAVTFGPGR